MIGHSHLGGATTMARFMLGHDEKYILEDNFKEDLWANVQAGYDTM